MLDLQATKHADARMRQRGYRKADIDLVRSVGTRVGENAFLLTDQDAAQEIEKCKRKIQQVERLRGSKLIVDGETLITLYHTQKKSRKFHRTAQRGGDYDI